MVYLGTVLSVADVKSARKFYEDLFGLEVYQDYGINISFTCGLSLQQEFDWLIQIPKDKIVRQPNNMELYFEEKDFDGFLRKLKAFPEIRFLGDVIEQSWGQRVIRFYDLDGHIIEVGESMKMVIERFLATGLSLDEISKKMDVSITDLQELLKNS